jgi:hypothetical protein
MTLGASGSHSRYSAPQTLPILSLYWRKGFNRFNQPDGPNAYQVLQVLTGVVEFFDDVNTKQRKRFITMIDHLDKFIFLHT